MRALQCILFSLLFASRSVYADWQMNLTAGITPVSHDIYDLHMTVIWVCVGIGTLVFGVMIYSIIFHRKALGVKPAQFHEHLWLELTWTIIPFLILVLLAIPGTRVLVNMNDESKPDLTIKITGYQWKWRYEYIDQGIQFFSNLSTPVAEMQGKVSKNPYYLREVDHALVVPIHKKIRFLVTSNDVIHAWWVPDLGVKRDAVPGFINESWARVNRPGIYRGQCAELCGLNHAFMPIVVIAMAENDYNKWLAQQKGTPPAGIPAAATTPKPTAPTPPIATTVKPALTIAPAAAPTTTATQKMSKDDLMKQGEQVFMTSCSACHQPTGEGLPPTYPALKGSAIVKGPLPAHLNRVLNGKQGTAMQAFRDQFSDADLAAVITYERNAWGNNDGDVVQPDQIAAAKALPPQP